MRGRHAGWATVVKMRRFDVVVPCRARLDVVLIQGDVAATGIEGDFLLGGDADFVFGAGDLQRMAGHQFQGVVLRLNAHWPLVGDQLHSELVDEQAQPLAYAINKRLTTLISASAPALSIRLFCAASCRCLPLVRAMPCGALSSKTEALSWSSCSRMSDS